MNDRYTEAHEGDATEYTETQRKFSVFLCPLWQAPQNYLQRKCAKQQAML